MPYPLNRYLNIRWADSPVFSADSLSLAFRSDITGQLQAWQMDLAGRDEAISWPGQLTFTGERVLFLTYSPVEGDKRLLYGHDVGGSEKAQLFLLETTSGEEVSFDGRV